MEEKISPRNEKVIFVINPSLWGQSMYPSGILFLSSYLSLKGIDNTILDSKITNRNLSNNEKEELIINTIIKANPSVVCFSASHRSYDEVVRLNKELKKRNEKIITIVGGSQPTYRAEDFLNNSFNFVGIGEGEETLYEFVNAALSGEKRWERIKGLAWKKKGANVFNQPRPPLTEYQINQVVMPAYDKIDKKYFDMSGSVIRGMVLKGALLLTTRGCPFNCSFCGCNLIFGRKLRFRSLENIEKEIVYLKNKFGIEGIWIVDDTFTIKKDHVIGVSNILKKHKIIWGCQSRVNTLDEELIKIMKKNGCVQIDFGVESGSQRILDEIIGKGIKISQVINSFQLSKKYEIRSLANFMIGLPSETEEDLRKTIELADKIKADAYIFSIATPLPGTKMFDMVGEEISPSEYSLMDWNGSSLTNRLNKSEIKNISKVLKKLQKKYNRKSFAQSLVSLNIIKFFLTRPHKIKRIIFVLKYVLKVLSGKNR